MNKKGLIFLITALVTGVIGFSGWRFEGVEFIRIIFLLAFDAFIITILARFLFPNKQLELERVKRK